MPAARGRELAQLVGLAADWVEVLAGSRASKASPAVNNSILPLGSTTPLPSRKTALPATHNNTPLPRPEGGASLSNCGISPVKEVLLTGSRKSTTSPAADGSTPRTDGTPPPPSTNTADTTIASRPKCKASSPRSSTNTADTALASHPECKEASSPRSSSPVPISAALSAADNSSGNSAWSGSGNISLYGNNSIYVSDSMCISDSVYVSNSRSRDVPWAWQACLAVQLVRAVQEEKDSCAVEHLQVCVCAYLCL